MNMFHVSIGGSVRSNYQTKSVFAGNLPGIQTSMLKSTQEKMERQQKAGSEIAFWEKQKESLKEKECATVEEIAKKLEMFHNYEDEIAAVKAAYNKEQMSHILDEAEEQGKKNAEAAEKLEPKTPEERREELVEEALGTEDSESILDEMLDGVQDSAEELQESQEQLLEELPEEAAALEEELLEEAANMEEQLPEAAMPGIEEQLPEEAAVAMEGQLLGEQPEEVTAAKEGHLPGTMAAMGGQTGNIARELQSQQRPVQQSRHRGMYQGFDARV